MIYLFPGHCSLKFVQFLHVNCNIQEVRTSEKSNNLRAQNLSFYVSVNTFSMAALITNHLPYMLQKQNYRYAGHPLPDYPLSPLQLKYM